MDLMDPYRKAAGAGRYDAVRRILSRLDRQTRTRLLEHLASMPVSDGRPMSPLRAMLLQLLTNRRREHTRRLWARWLEPVMQRDPTLLGITAPLPGTVPGFIHSGDLTGWWRALARRMGDVPASIQSCIEDRLIEAPFDHVMATDEAARWSDFLRLRSLAILQGLRSDPKALAAFLDDANAPRVPAGIDGPAAEDRPHRLLSSPDVDTLTIALRVAPAWQRFGGRAAAMEVEDLLLCVRRALSGGGMPPDAMALYAVAGLYARRDPLLGAALRALLPLPLVEAAVDWLAACAGGTLPAAATDIPAWHHDQLPGLDHGLRALFDTAMTSGRPLTPADAKRLGRALAGVVDVHAPHGGL